MEHRFEAGAGAGSETRKGADARFDPTLESVRKTLLAGFAAAERGNWGEAESRYDAALRQLGAAQSFAGEDGWLRADERGGAGKLTGAGRRADVGALLGLNDPEALTFAGIITARRGDLPGSATILQRASDLLEQGGGPEWVGESEPFAGSERAGGSGQATEPERFAGSERAAALYENLAGVYTELGNYAGVARAAARAVDEIERLGSDHGRLANALFNLGTAASVLGEHARAVEALERAAHHARQLGSNDIGWVRIEQALGSALLASGAPEKALKHLLEAYKSYSLLAGQEVEAAQCQFEVARALGMLERFSEAAGGFALAAELAANRDANQIAAIAWHHQAVALAQAGQLGQAVIPMGRACEAYEDLELSFPAAHCLGLIGDLFAQAGKPVEAAGYFSEAVSRFEELEKDAQAQLDELAGLDELSRLGDLSVLIEFARHGNEASSAESGMQAADIGADRRRVAEYLTAIRAELEEFRAKLASAGG